MSNRFTVELHFEIHSRCVDASYREVQIRNSKHEIPNNEQSNKSKCSKRRRLVQGIGYLNSESVSSFEFRYSNLPLTHDLAGFFAHLPLLRRLELPGPSLLDLQHEVVM